MLSEGESVMRTSSDKDREFSFERLVVNHADSVHRYLKNRCYLGDALDPEDLLAEVFAIAWRRMDDIPRDAERPWLIGVARNRLMNMRSKQRRRRSKDQYSRPPVSTTPSAEEEVVAESSLNEAIDALPESEREALLLSVWEGLTTLEISVALGITENAARIRLSRAKSLLLARLSAEDSERSDVFAKESE
jgi:RNA polymerase sigma-70 factor (ECF subfamily)